MNKDCAGYMCFTFLHDESAEGYDEEIAGDVHLRIYQDNVLYDSGIVSYAEIRGGREYRVRKEVTGEIDIVAWAVPSLSEFTEKIPEVSEDKERTGELLVMEPATRQGTYRSLGSLYLGTFTHDETSLTTETKYPISMKSCVAKFTATIHNVSELYEPGQQEEIYIIIHGSKAEMDVDLTPKGEDAPVAADFTEVLAPGIIKTKEHGLLPTAEGEYLSIEAYRDEEYHGRMTTDIRVRAGDIVHIDIYRHTVSVYINDWRVSEESIEWI